jgi:hypothetical protein
MTCLGNRDQVERGVMDFASVVKIHQTPTDDRSEVANSPGELTAGGISEFRSGAAEYLRFAR